MDLELCVAKRSIFLARGLNEFVKEIMKIRKKARQEERKKEREG